ncbi:hypothetical protein JL721_3447 [Aureococcus anophagefferens]|nr:hypothetical protein JL721_3447 [Aureococcus anophagefferens]
MTTSARTVPQRGTRSLRHADLSGFPAPAQPQKTSQKRRPAPVKTESPRAEAYRVALSTARQEAAAARAAARLCAEALVEQERRFGRGGGDVHEGRGLIHEGLSAEVTERLFEGARRLDGHAREETRRQEWAAREAEHAAELARRGDAAAADARRARDAAASSRRDGDAAPAAAFFALREQHAAAVAGHATVAGERLEYVGQAQRAVEAAAAVAVRMKAAEDALETHRNASAEAAARHERDLAQLAADRDATAARADALEARRPADATEKVASLERRLDDAETLCASLKELLAARTRRRANCWRAPRRGRRRRRPATCRRRRAARQRGGAATLETASMGVSLGVLDGALVVAEARGDAAAAGLEAGDVVVSVGDEDATDLEPKAAAKVRKARDAGVRDIDFVFARRLGPREPAPESTPAADAAAAALERSDREAALERELEGTKRALDKAAAFARSLDAKHKESLRRGSAPRLVGDASSRADAPSAAAA